jgi:hypothetical protein
MRARRSAPPARPAMRAYRWTWKRPVLSGMRPEARANAVALGLARPMVSSATSAIERKPHRGDDGHGVT